MKYSANKFRFSHFLILFVAILCFSFSVGGALAYFTATASEKGELNFHSFALDVNGSVFTSTITGVVPGDTLTFSNVKISNTGSADAYVLVNINVDISKNDGSTFNVFGWYNLAGSIVEYGNMAINTTGASIIQSGATTTFNRSHTINGERFDTSFAEATATLTIRAVGIQTKNLPNNSTALSASQMLVDKFAVPSVVYTLNSDGKTYSASALNTDITSANILVYYRDKDVTAIGTRAFAGCTKLTSVAISSTVKTIGPYAFEGCTSLVSNITLNSETDLRWVVYNSSNSIVCEDASTLTKTQLLTYLKGNYTLKQEKLSTVTIDELT